MDNRVFGDDDMDLLANEWNLDELLNAGFDESDLLGIKIPEENKSIDEKSMSETENECPKCGFKW
jgi:hypothetical protein